MKVSASALLLVIGTSDAFTSSTSWQSSTTSLKASRIMTGGVQGSHIMDDRSPPDVDAAWGKQPIHTWRMGIPPPRPVQSPSGGVVLNNIEKQPPGVSGGAFDNQAQGYRRSALDLEPVNPESTYSPAFYKMNHVGVHHVGEYKKSQLDLEPVGPETTHSPAFYKMNHVHPGPPPAYIGGSGGVFPNHVGEYRRSHLDLDPVDPESAYSPSYYKMQGYQKPMMSPAYQQQFQAPPPPQEVAPPPQEEPFAAASETEVTPPNPAVQANPAPVATNKAPVHDPNPPFPAY